MAFVLPPSGTLLVNSDDTKSWLKANKQQRELYRDYSDILGHSQGGLPQPEDYGTHILSVEHGMIYIQSKRSGLRRKMLLLEY